MGCPSKRLKVAFTVRHGDFLAYLAGGDVSHQKCNFKSFSSLEVGWKHPSQYYYLVMVLGNTLGDAEGDNKHELRFFEGVHPLYQFHPYSNLCRFYSLVLSTLC